MTPVRETSRTTYKMDKKLDKSQKSHSKYLVPWRSNSRDFNSWVPASSVKNM